MATDFDKEEITSPKTLKTTNKTEYRKNEWPRHTNRDYYKPQINHLSRMFFFPIFNQTLQYIRCVMHVLRILPQHPYKSCFSLGFLNIFAADIPNNCNAILTPLWIFP